MSRIQRPLSLSLQPPPLPTLLLLQQLQQQQQQQQHCHHHHTLFTDLHFFSSQPGTQGKMERAGFSCYDILVVASRTRRTAVAATLTNFPRRRQIERPLNVK